MMENLSHSLITRTSEATFWPSENRTKLPRRSISNVLAALNRSAGRASPLLFNQGAHFENGGRRYDLPRYLFIGPKGGDEPLRIGIFAGIHGDEPEGVHALLRFLEALAKDPESGRGYCFFAYPICNPTGFEDRTRNSRNGKDLNREFWRGSNEPEVRLLESELTAHSFHGIISLHTDDTSDGFYGFAKGATLTRHLIGPALRAAGEYLPVNRNTQIDGFQACNGVIRSSYTGVLSAPPKVRPRPFEITLETPAAPPVYLKEAALVAALRTVLVSYREFIAYAPNL
jgi:murein peptide amidase A